MKVYSFVELDERGKKQLYSYLIKNGWNHYIETYEEMLRNYGGAVFNFGESYFSLWESGEILGTMAAITKEITNSGEAFVTGINMDYMGRVAECFKILIEKCENYCISKGVKKITLGITPDLDFLQPNIESFGYRHTHKVLVMKYRCSDEVSTQSDISPEISFEMLSNQNKGAFKIIHNEAFRQSPNAAFLDDEDMKRLVEDCKTNPVLKGVCLYQGRPAGIYRTAAGRPYPFKGRDESGGQLC
ncbi:MAG: hypothetical protein PWP45_1939 [Tepidanaerobacteraceae bacterium]|nr:hypothetical protein [Tepidanaerobacteraceae bacterium]